MTSEAPAPTSPIWTLKRPPAFRYCVLESRCTAWPDEGQGLWIINGFEDCDTPNEVFLLLRVGPARPGGPSGETIRVHRSTHESGHLRVWRADREDPALNLPR